MTCFRLLTLSALLSVAAAERSYAAPLTYADFDTRPGGSQSVVAFSNDGNGSLQLTTDGSSAKAGVVLFRTDGMPLGTLGNLTSATFDYFKSSSSTTPANSAPAIRFLTNAGGTQGLTWERAYQTASATPTDSWQTNVDLLGQLWQRANSHNFDQVANLNTLSGYVAGFTPSDPPFAGVTFNADTPIYGVSITFGSGIGGQFLGNVDNLRLGFSNGTYSYDFALASPVPEPTTLAVFGAVAVVAGWSARRRRKPVTG